MVTTKKTSKLLDAFIKKIAKHYNIENTAELVAIKDSIFNKKKDENLPKRASSSFILYSKYEYKHVKTTRIVKATNWANESKSKSNLFKKYTTMAQTDRDRYIDEKKTYYNTHPKKQTRKRAKTAYQHFRKTVQKQPNLSNTEHTEFVKHQWDLCTNKQVFIQLRDNEMQQLGLVK